MGTRNGKNPPDGIRRDAGSRFGASCEKAGLNKDLEKRIRDARAALHDAIRRAGDRPLSQSPEVLQLSRVLDALIDEMHGREDDQ